MTFSQRPYPGDLNLDNKVDAVDQSLMRLVLTGNTLSAAIDPANADLNGDGRIDSADSVILHFLAAGYRGGLISSQPMGTTPRWQITFILLQLGLSSQFSALFDVAMYKLVYQTIGPHGELTTASGMMALPVGRTGELPWISVAHGTEVEKTEVPSDPQYIGNYLPAAVYVSSGGYAAVGADFLGLGESPGLHPYLHAGSEATACVDMLRAARAAAAADGASLTGRLFLAGYSQGGHATMALHRELEQRHADEFTVTASAPMAGPYDISGTCLPYVLNSSGTDAELSYYTVYILEAWNLVYGFYASPGEVYLPPYDTTIPPLFDGMHSSSEIMQALGPSLTAILQPQFISALRDDPDCPFNIAARDNDVYDWRPLAPVRLYHGKADTTVPFANAEVAYARMLELGADVTLVNLGDNLNHGTALIPAIVASRLWFDTLNH